MNKKKYNKFKRLTSSFILSLCASIYCSMVVADYFAYIPDEATNSSGKYLHVVNTKYNLISDSILLFGDPREVVLSHKGNYVYVSTVITEETRTASTINVISTQTNKTILPLTIPHESIRGLTLTKDDSFLYATHKDGISRVFIEPTFKFDRVDLALRFSGMSMVLSDDEKYLFVIGTDGEFDGVSVVDISQDEPNEVAALELGPDTGASSIVFDKSTNELFVLNRTTSQLVNLRINNYDTPSAVELTLGESKQFISDSYPVDLALNADSSELFVALSFLKDGVGYGDGYITVLNPAQINGESVYDRIPLSDEGGNFAPVPGSQSGFGAIHPLAIAFDNATPEKLHVIKQIWNEYSGTYVSSINDVTNIRSGDRKITESTSVHLGKRSSTQITGTFIGPDCSNCPDGLIKEPDPDVRPSAISPLMLSFLFLIILQLRRMYLYKQK